MPMAKADGLIMMFDGHFHKGLAKFIKGDPNAPKYSKENHYQKAPKKK